jgi:hypothetical protein
MAYKLDYVHKASYSVIDGQVVTRDHAVAYLLSGKYGDHIDLEIARITFQGKNIADCVNRRDAWLESSDGKLSLSIAESEFGIDRTRPDMFCVYHYSERTPR